MRICRGNEAIQLLSGDTCSGEANIVCPYCRCDYSHVSHGGTLLGADSHEAVIYEGTDISGATPSRRSAFEIVFECEACEQRFALVIQQHKGMNFVEIHKDVKAKI